MSEDTEKGKGITRRDFIKYASASAGITAASLALTRSLSSGPQTTSPPVNSELLHGHPSGVAVPAQTEGGLGPMDFLSDFYRGQFNSQGEREFSVLASPTPLTVARGVQFPAWTFAWQRNGVWVSQVPGPTLRATQGDRVRIRFRNGDSHPHTIHLHGIHQGLADGVFEPVESGGTYDYVLDAEPFGLFLYHCHIMPVKKHIMKGLYGAFIIDPPASYGVRPKADYEFVMVMNGFDVDFDDENDLYTVNGIANYFLENPITIGAGKLVRIYLVNMTEFDPVNSFHLHGNVFRLFRTGTRFDPSADPFDFNPLTADRFAEITDTVFLGQGERAVLEFVPRHTGRFLFHAHQSEFIELGWAGLFNVV